MPADRTLEERLEETLDCQRHEVYDRVLAIVHAEREKAREEQFKADCAAICRICADGYEAIGYPGFEQGRLWAHPAPPVFVLCPASPLHEAHARKGGDK